MADRLHILWEKLGNTPINEDEEIDEVFLDFPIGTSIYDIWHWFEDTFDISIASLMGLPVDWPEK